jgi:DNA-binding LacI/PurR family transcriptional regulator
MKDRVTMQTVARTAGVHQTTVSLALRGHARIPSDTREKILRVAKELGYRPNPLVSALISSRHRRGRTRSATLGYVTADDPAHGGSQAVQGYRDLFEGATRRAEQLGYGLDTFWLGDKRFRPARFNQITATRGIHGLILAPLAVQSPTLQIDWTRFSTVAYGYSIAEPHIHRVNPDFYHSMTAALLRCRNSGYRRVGLVLDKNTDRKADHFWLSAFLAEQRLTPRAEPIEPLLLEQWDPREFARWFKHEQPEVIIGLHKIIVEVESWVKNADHDVQLILLNAEPTGSLRRFAGVVNDREYVGAICVDFVVAMIHRNEKGIPARAQNLLVEMGWHPAPSFKPKAVV